MTFQSIIPDYRTPGQKDTDRILFSEEFRTLSGKSRIHTRKNPELARNRLTHAIEVSRIASVLTEHLLPYLNPACIPSGHQNRTEQTFCEAAAAASLLHDIGSTPWSDPTEKEIGLFFKETKEGNEILEETPKEEHEDFLHFNSDMQSFRIATRETQEAFLNLSPLTLAASVKNPHSANQKQEKPPGLFHSSLEHYREIQKILGINITQDHSGWNRHPLAYITETADDIAYIMADIEDALSLKTTKIEEVVKITSKILGGEENISSEIKDIKLDKKILSWLRYRCITTMISSVTEAVKNPETTRLILSGRMNPPDILKHTAISNQINTIQIWSQKKISITQTEKKPQTQKILKIISRHILGEKEDNELKNLAEYFLENTKGHKAHAMVDLVCSLTDHQFNDLDLYTSS